MLVTDGAPDCHIRGQGQGQGKGKNVRVFDGRLALEAASIAYTMQGQRVYVVGIGNFAECSSKITPSDSKFPTGECPRGHVRVDRLMDDKDKNEDGLAENKKSVPKDKDGEPLLCTSPRGFIEQLARVGGTGHAYVSTNADAIKEALGEAVAAQRCTIPWSIGAHQVLTAVFSLELPGKDSVVNTYFRIPDDDACRDFGMVSFDDAEERAKEEDAKRCSPAEASKKADAGTTTAETLEPTSGWKYCAATGELRFYGKACEDYRGGAVPVPYF